MTQDISLSLSENVGPEEPEQRRWWLLRKALECAPLQEALNLARAAEAFVSGSSVTTTIAKDRAAQADNVQTGEQIVEAQPRVAVPADASRPAPLKRSGLSLSPDRRTELLRRLAAGAKNAELAHEFGLSRQQVQGVRMGCAREIATYRDRDKANSARQESTDQAERTTSAEDVIRYLRQQDDVVVPEGGDQFVVNGRFHLRLPELLERANRMRRRQGKPEFGIPAQVKQPAQVSSANGHPLFWAKDPATTGLNP